MSALGTPVLINQNRPYWLSSIGNEVRASTIICDSIDANVANISTINTEDFEVSTFRAQSVDCSGLSFSTFEGDAGIISSLGCDTGTFSTIFLKSGDNTLPFLRFTSDPSGVQVDGAAIRFDNLVYLTSTINIIQVSTLVDTDIFAANGFFSTLSSGSLSVGVASFDLASISSISANITSINAANISSLYVSSLEGYDISGAEPSEWSLYPTLNSSITFQPGFVLSNINNRLFFTGQDLTDLSGANQWSRFPAFSTVYMNSNNISQLSSLFFLDGGRLTSQTGNNLLYNGLPVQVGNASNITQWASYPAVSSVNGNNFNISNVSTFSGCNLNLTGNSITNGTAWVGNLGVGGTTLTPLATIQSGDIVCRNLQVGDSITGLADVEIYGATALPGDNALYVEGGVTCAGGTIHGFTAGVLPVGGINTGRIDMLQAGFNLLHPLVGAITTGAAMAITSGGALSVAAGGFVEVNTSTIQCINTTQGNKNTTLQTGFLTIDPDIGATSSIKLFNTLGGGVEIDGGGQGSMIGFSTINGGNVSSLNVNASSINVLNNVTASGLIAVGLNVSSIGAISTLLYNQASGLSTTVGQISCININVSTINGQPWDLDPIDNRYSTLIVSTIFLESTLNTPLNLDVSGGLTVTGDIFVDFNKAVQFDSGAAFSQFEYRDVAANSMLALTNNPGLASNNMERLGLGELWLTTGADQYAAVKMYSVFPGDNLNIDMIDANGSLMAQIVNVAATGGCNYATTLNGVSSIHGYNTGLPGNEAVTYFDNLIAVPKTSTLGANISSINSFVSFNAPSLIVNGDEAELRLKNPLGQGTVFSIESAQNNGEIRVLNSSLTGFLNLYLFGDNFGFNTNNVVGGFELDISGNTIVEGFLRVDEPSGKTDIGGGWVSTLQLETISTFNGADVSPCFVNALQLSSMNLIQNSTTLLQFSTTTANSNVVVSGTQVQPNIDGTYKIGVSLQFNNTSGNDEVEFFFIKNFVTIPNAGGIVNIRNNTESLEYIEIVETLNGGDKIEVGCFTASSDVFLSTIQGAKIESPAAILTMYKVN